MVSPVARGFFPIRKDMFFEGLLVWALLGACLFSLSARASESNFEIHVFLSETVDAGRAMVELHSNMAISGTTQKTEGVLPTQHALNESLEVAYGFTSWFETALYTAASVQPGMDGQYVGNRIMPRIRVPEQWDWPVGLGLGTAVTYQRRPFSTDTWTLEIVPIIDKRWGPWYLAGQSSHRPRPQRGRYQSWLGVQPQLQSQPRHHAEGRCRLRVLLIPRPSGRVLFVPKTAAPTILRR